MYQQCEYFENKNRKKTTTYSRLTIPLMWNVIPLKNEEKQKKKEIRKTSIGMSMCLSCGVQGTHTHTVKCVSQAANIWESASSTKPACLPALEWPWILIITIKWTDAVCASDYHICMWLWLRVCMNIVQWLRLLSFCLQIKFTIISSTLQPIYLWHILLICFILCVCVQLRNFFESIH